VHASLNHGRELVAIPGPSIVPDRVLSAMHRAMPDIYDGELLDVTDEVFAALPSIARASGAAFITISNGHGAWEMALTNTLCKHDKVLVLESGRFALVWGDLAAACGLDVEVLHAPQRSAVDPDAFAARLAADRAHEIKAILVVHVDTASSVRNDIAALHCALHDIGHPALLMVDCIASLGSELYEMDEWGVDVTVGASQKALMLPPGLGFVWANQRALEAHRHADLRTGYWDWTHRLQEGPHYLRYCGTPPVPLLFGLREALRMLDEEGLEAAWARHDVFGRAVRAAVEGWSTDEGLELNIVDPAARSNSVTTVLTGSIDAERLRAICRHDAGLTLGVGLEGGRAFRFGHMGHLNPPMVLGMLATTEAALVSMGAPIAASGLAAAARVVGEALAGAVTV
jgi:alanine-glyoxylate transaminase/serine-glyoxylate transaminase/serine-pyruvate transaminase